MAEDDKVILKWILKIKNIRYYTDSCGRFSTKLVEEKPLLLGRFDPKDGGIFIFWNLDNYN
jgi:hypothetical protein